MPPSLPSKDQAFDAARANVRPGLKIDPDNSDALAGKPIRLSSTILTCRSRADTTMTQRSSVCSTEIAPDRGNLHAYRTKGNTWISAARRGPVLARRRARDRSETPPLLATRSTADDYSGRFEQAKSDIEQAMLLSPATAMSQ